MSQSRLRDAGGGWTMDCRLIPHRLLAAGALMRRGFHVAAAHRCASVLPKHCFQRVIALLLHAEKATIGAQKLCFDAPICLRRQAFAAPTTANNFETTWTDKAGRQAAVRKILCNFAPQTSQGHEAVSGPADGFLPFSKRVAPPARPQPFLRAPLIRRPCRCKFGKMEKTPFANGFQHAI